MGRAESKSTSPTMRWPAFLVASWGVLVDQRMCCAWTVLHTWDMVDANVDDYCTRLEPFSAHEAWLPNGGYDNVCASKLWIKTSTGCDVVHLRDTYNFWQVLRPAMTLRDRCVHIPEHSSHGATDYIATTQHDDIGASNWNASRFEKVQCTGGRARRVKGVRSS